MEDKLLDRIKADALDIIRTKTEGIREAQSIQDLIDNSLCDVMVCPSMYGLKENCSEHHGCKYCWEQAVSKMENK